MKVVVNVSLTLTNTNIWFVAALCFIVDVQTDVRTYATCLFQECLCCIILIVSDALIILVTLISKERV